MVQPLKSCHILVRVDYNDLMEQLPEQLGNTTVTRTAMMAIPQGPLKASDSLCMAPVAPPTADE